MQKRIKCGVFTLRWSAAALLCEAAGALWQGVSSDGVWGCSWQPKLRFCGPGAGCKMVAEILTAENKATRSSKEQV